LTHLDGGITCQKSPGKSQRYSGDYDLNPYEKHMGSTTLGDANPAAMTGLAAPQNIEMDRGSHGRVRVDGRT
jgi:hypothetical protein